MCFVDVAEPLFSDFFKILFALDLAAVKKQTAESQ